MVVEYRGQRMFHTPFHSEVPTVIGIGAAIHEASAPFQLSFHGTDNSQGFGIIAIDEEIAVHMAVPSAGPVMRHANPDELAAGGFILSSHMFSLARWRRS